MDFSILLRMWHDDANVEFGLMLIGGLAFLCANFCLFIILWYMRRGIAIEYGYPKRNSKQMKKRMSAYSTVEKLLLVRLTHEAERKGWFLYLNLACHFLNVISMALCFVGFVGSLITLGDGWACTLLISPVLCAMFFTFIIEFIPQIIYLPSVRRKYKW